MSDLDKLRQQARDLSCGDDVTLAKFTAPAGRPPEHCEPDTTPTPDVFKSPVAPDAEAAPPPATPGHVTFSNDDVTINCADVEGAGPVGLPVSVPQGTLQLHFYWQSVPGILTRQLGYIATLPQSAITVLVDPACTLTLCRAITKLDIPQARYVISTFEALRTQVNDQADKLARASIRCVWVNETQTAECEAGAFTEAPDGFLAIIANPVIVTGGAVESELSQSDANARALNLARSGLSCWYGNDTQTVTCVDIGFGEEVPVDTVAIGTTARVGRVTIEANTFVSQDGKAAVNDQAYSAAVAGLVCFYINDDFTRRCEDIGSAPGTVVDASEYSSGLPGNPVHIAAGTVESLISTEDANSVATSLADGLLSCVWTNAAVSKTCASLTVINPDGLEEVVPPSVRSPVITATVPAGTVTSDSSQADADEQAALMALLQLDCIYCNSLIKPVCLPPSIANQDPFPLPIPIPSASFDPAWSIDATPGVAKDTFCSSVPLDALLIAHSVGVIPISNLSVGRSCRYINDEIRVSCVSGGGIIGPFDESARTQLSRSSYPDPMAVDTNQRYLIFSAGAVEIAEDEVPAEFEPGDENRAKHYVNLLARQQALSLLNCFFENNERVFTCAETLGLTDVYSGSTDNVAVAAGAFTSTRSKSEAEEEALAFGRASLNCFYANKKSKFLCAAGALYGTYNPLPVGPDIAGYMVFGAGSMSPSGVVSQDSRGSAQKPVIIDEATFTSGVSQAEADLQALVMARSILDCFWSNDPVKVYCYNYGKGAEGVVSVDVAEGIFRSYISKDEANNQARAYGRAQTFCYFSNDEILRRCSSAPGWSPSWIPAGGSVVDFTVPAGSITSPTSKDAANATAAAIATSSLVCLYVNQEQTPDPCPVGTSPSVLGVVIPQDTVTAISTPAANLAAKAMANAIQSCVDDSGGPRSGPPGNDGGPGSCTGDCVGYFAS